MVCIQWACVAGSRLGQVEGFCAHSPESSDSVERGE